MNHYDNLWIHRCADSSFIYPDSYAGLKTALTEFGHLIDRGDRINLDRFLEVVATRSPNPLSHEITTPMKRWLDLMEHATDYCIKHSMLPKEFHWHGRLYGFDECLEILGSGGLKLLFKTARRKRYRASITSITPQSVAA